MTSIRVSFPDGQVGSLSIDYLRLIYGGISLENMMRIDAAAPLEACTVGERVDKRWDPELLMEALWRAGLPCRLNDGSFELLDHPLIGRRYFFPQRVPLPDAVEVLVRGATLACWRSGPPSDRPLFVHFHGNGELVHHWIPDFVPAIQAMGYDVFLAEYRGYGGSTGRPLMASMLDDVSEIVRATGVPAHRIVAFGRSIGSLYATELVRRFPAAAGLILESGISDLSQRLDRYLDAHELGTSREGLSSAVSQHFDQLSKLRNYRGPTLILHARHDHLVGFEHAEANHSASGSSDKQLVGFARGDHNSILAANATAYFEHLKHFLSRVR